MNGQTQRRNWIVETCIWLGIFALDFSIGLVGRPSGGSSSTEVRFGGDTAEIGSDVSGFSGGAGATGMVGYVYISTELPSGDQAQN